MGLTEFLGKIWSKVEEYGPQAIDYMQKAVEKSEGDAKKKKEELEVYKRKFQNLDDAELVDEFNKQISPIGKAVIKELLYDRIEKYKKKYKNYSEILLINFLNCQDSPIKKKVIVTLLKERGYEKDADNVWQKGNNSGPELGSHPFQ